MKKAMAFVLAAMAASVALGAETPEIVARSVVSRGETGRLARVFEKGRRGEPLVLGVIGGSITAGAAATTIPGRYADLVAAHLREMFPKSKVTLVNAGVGATGSAFGCLRVGRDLLGARPDLVIAEFAVNDPNTKEAAETMEGMTRQILNAPGRPALMYLFTMHQDGSNAQEWHGRVGAHYGLPMISYRDAMWPEIEGGRLKWQDVSPDVVHPNDRGHAACAQFISHFLDEVMKEKGAVEGEVPGPLLTDLFERTWIAEAGELKPVRNQGWELVGGAWRATKPGSVIEFELRDASAACAMYYRIRGGTGRCAAQVDDRPAVELDGWFPATWGGYRETTTIAKDLGAGKHRLTLTLLEGKAAESTGHEFRLMGLGGAGVR